MSSIDVNGIQNLTREKVGKKMPWDAVMHKFGAGKLKSSSGQPVTDQKQALAIMESEKHAAANGKEEYKSSTPKDHPLHKLKRKRRAQ